LEPTRSSAGAPRSGFFCQPKDRSVVLLKEQQLQLQLRTTEARNTRKQHGIVSGVPLVL
jgi:hypothetical protein